MAPNTKNRTHSTMGNERWIERSMSWFWVWYGTSKLVLHKAGAAQAGGLRWGGNQFPAQFSNSTWWWSKKVYYGDEERWLNKEMREGLPLQMSDFNCWSQCSCDHCKRWYLLHAWQVHFIGCPRLWACHLPGCFAMWGGPNKSLTPLSRAR